MAVPANDDAIVSLRELGLSPLEPYYPRSLPGRYRLGTDILRSGEFDYEGLFGTRSRAWIRGRSDTVAGSYKVRVLPGDVGARVGMKGFQRVYTKRPRARHRRRLRHLQVAASHDTRDDVGSARQRPDA